MDNNFFKSFLESFLFILGIHMITLFSVLAIVVIIHRSDIAYHQHRVITEIADVIAMETNQKHLAIRTISMETDWDGHSYIATNYPQHEAFADIADSLYTEMYTDRDKERSEEYIRMYESFTNHKVVRLTINIVRSNKNR